MSLSVYTSVYKARLRKSLAMYTSLQLAHYTQVYKDMDIIVSIFLKITTVNPCHESTIIITNCIINITTSRAYGYDVDF